MVNRTLLLTSDELPQSVLSHLSWHLIFLALVFMSDIVFIALYWTVDLNAIMSTSSFHPNRLDHVLFLGEIPSHYAREFVTFLFFFFCVANSDVKLSTLEGACGFTQLQVARQLLPVPLTMSRIKLAVNVRTTVSLLPHTGNDMVLSHLRIETVL